MAERSLVYRFEGKFDNLRGGLASAGKSVDDFNKKLMATDRQGAQMRASLGHVGDTAGRIALGSAAGIAAISKAAMDWESQWASVTKTVNGSKAELADLEAGLRSMAKSMPATHQEIAEVAASAGALGVATPNIESFTKTMVQLGTATDDLSADQAATAIAQMANVMGTAPADIERLSSTLVALGNNGASTEGQIMAMAQRLSGAGKLVGASEGEVLALSNAMSSMGIEAELGGGAMSRTLQKMYSAVKDGGGQLQQFAEVAGVSASEFAQAFTSSPVEAVDLLVQGLNAIDASGGNAVQALGSLGFEGTQDLSVLLRLKGAGDLLSESLNTQADAWSKNTALSDEFEAKAATSASQVQIAWNRIKDAAIDAGAVMLPVVSTVADKVADLAGVFQSLPGPVQGALGPLAGITAILGGGMWFTAKAVNGVHEMRSALAGLSVDAPKAGRAVSMAGKAAGVAGLALAGLAIGEALQAIGEESKIAGVEKMRDALLGLASAKTGSSIAQEFDGISKSIDRLTDKKIGDKINDIGAGILGFGHGKTFNNATAQIENLDSALAKLVGSGNADQAATALEVLAQQQGLSAGEMEQLLSILPQYSESLAGQSADAKLAASGHKTVAGAIEEEASALEKLLEGMKKEHSERLKAEGGLTAFGAAMNSVNDSLAENGASFDWATEAGQNNRSALEGAIGAWNNLDSAGRKAAGGFDVTREKLVKMAESFGMSRAAAEKYVDRLMDIPPKKATEVSLQGVDMAILATKGLKAALEDLRDRQITVATRFTQSGVRIVRPSSPGGGRDTGGGSTAADGGTVPTTGLPYADRHPYLLADAEEVTSNRFGQADRFRPELKLMNANAPAHMVAASLLNRMAVGRLADGGTVGLANGGTARAVGFGRSVADVYMVALTRELKRLTSATEKATSRRDELAGLADSLRSSVGDKFRSELFNTRPGAFIGAQTDPLAILDGNSAAYERQIALQKRAKNAGISEKAFDEFVAKASLGEMEAKLNQAGFADEYQRRFDRREKLAAAAGGNAAEGAYGASLAVAEKQVRLAERAEKAAERQHSRAEKAAERRHKEAQAARKKIAGAGAARRNTRKGK